MNVSTYISEDGAPISLPAAPWDRASDITRRCIPMHTYITEVRRAGGWISSADIAQAIGATMRGVGAAMLKAHDRGIVERKYGGRGMAFYRYIGPDQDSGQNF